MLAAALGLIALVTGILAYRRYASTTLARAPQPVIFSADGSGRMSSVLRRFAALLGKRSGRPVTMEDVNRLFAMFSASDPVARPFADQFMAEPVLKKAWEGHQHDEDAKTFANEIIDTPELAKLLEQWQENPAFLVLAERTADAMEADAAQKSASADRIIMTEPQPPPPEPARAAPVLSSMRQGPSMTFASNIARFKSIFSLMPREPRDRVLAQMEQGLPVREACGRAAAARECDGALKSCEADPACASWLKQNEGSGSGGAPADKKSVIVLRDEQAEPEAAPSEKPPAKQTTGGGGGRGRDDDDGDDPPPRPSNPFAGMNLGLKSKPKSPTTQKSSPPPSETNCYRPKNCFVAGTRILTLNGEVPIEAIHAGDTVLSADLRSGELAAGTVLKTFRSEAVGLRRVRLSNGLELRVTEEHPFFDPESGAFRPVRELSAGDRVGRLSRSAGVSPSAPHLPGLRRPSPSGTFAPPPAVGLLDALTILAIEGLPSEGVSVFNFQVGGHENYFAEGILVHNKPCAF